MSVQRRVKKELKDWENTGMPYGSTRPLNYVVELASASRDLR